MWGPVYGSYSGEALIVRDPEEERDAKGPKGGISVGATQKGGEALN